MNLNRYGIDCRERERGGVRGGREGGRELADLQYLNEFREL